MPEKPADDEQMTNQETASARGNRKLFRLSVIIPVLLVAAVLILIFGRDHLSSTIRSARHAVSDRQLGPVFTRVPVDELLSSENVLRAVGRSPVDPGRVLSPELDKLGTTGSDKKPSIQPEGGTESGDRIAEDKPVPPAEGTEASPASGAPSEIPPPRNAPTVEVRAPGAAVPPTDQTDTEKIEPPKPQEATPAPPAEKNLGPAPTPTVGRFEDRGKPAKNEGKRAKKPGREDTATISAPMAPTEAPRTDQFQLPGSLTVKIHHYAGTVPKWGLMVILDDSASMAKKVRGWNPNRIQAATEAVENLPQALERGSKMAIRDFLCAKADGNAAKPPGPCLSHTLFEWTATPFTGIGEKLAQNSPGGKTNPCAAAAYALKRDFGSLGGLSPRLLLVTDGMHLCAFKEVLRDADKRGGKEKIPVDVLAFGMHRKRQAGYSKLAHRTNGMFLRIDNPGDLKSALNKYTKLLKTPVKEQIEVHGEKTVLTANPDEELTMVPGTYTIVLPAVAGISASKRTLDPIQIQSGESTVVLVRVNKKGRPVAKVEPGTKAGKK